MAEHVTLSLGELVAPPYEVPRADQVVTHPFVPEKVIFDGTFAGKVSFNMWLNDAPFATSRDLRAGDVIRLELINHSGAMVRTSVRITGRKPRCRHAWTHRPKWRRWAACWKQVVVVTPKSGLTEACCPRKPQWKCARCGIIYCDSHKILSEQLGSVESRCRPARGSKSSRGHNGGDR